jgi:hypothetical protein
MIGEGLLDWEPARGLLELAAMKCGLDRDGMTPVRATIEGGLRRGYDDFTNGQRKTVQSAPCLSFKGPPMTQHSAKKSLLASSVHDFAAYMPGHNYVFKPTRELWRASSVNARIGPISKIFASVAGCKRELVRNGIISSPAAEELLIGVAILNGYAAKDGFIAAEKTIYGGQCRASVRAEVRRTASLRP